MKIPLLSRVKSFGSKRHSSSSTTKSDTATTSNNSNKPVAPPQQQQTREQQQQAIKMGGSDQFLALAKARRSIYTLSKESTIPDSKIEEIVQEAVKWSPSTYNVQSARAVILFGDEHDKLWEIVKKHMDQVPMDEGMKGYIMGRIAGWKGSYGTVMWFEDQVALDALGDKNPMVKPMLTEWSDHSTGIHQFVVWTALEAEGLGANLQHFNFHPGVVAEVLSTWSLPETWKLKAQLVFGKPTGPAGEKTFEPIEKRVFVKRS